MEPVRVDPVAIRVARSRTDLDGVFEITSVPAGRFRVEVEIPRAPGRPRPPLVYYPGVTTRDAALIVEVRAGATAGDLTIVFPNIVEHTLRVQVQRPDAKITDLAVSILRASPLAILRLALNADGVAMVTGMVPGRYFVAAKAAFGRRQWAGYSVVDFDEASQEVALRLQRTGTITGRIVGNTDERPPLGGVHVAAVWIHDGKPVSPLVPDQATVSSKGAFRIDGVFGTRRLELLGLDWRWEVRAVMQSRTNVATSGIGIRPNGTTKVTIVVGRIAEPLTLLR
jgi:hypothetical protein